MGIHMFDGTTDMKLHCFHNAMLGTSGGVCHSYDPTMELQGTDI